MENKRYIALLRGINVGKTKRIDMKALKTLFEQLGYNNVSTYINSGNVFFESDKTADLLQSEIESGLLGKFELDVPVLVKSQKELQEIVAAIPTDWQNNDSQRTDVAYLFPDMDNEKIVAELPIKREFVDIRYTPGAIIWHVLRENVHKSHLNKLISHPIYQQMTIRNINTARYLAQKQTSLPHKTKGSFE